MNLLLQEFIVNIYPFGWCETGVFIKNQQSFYSKSEYSYGSLIDAFTLTSIAATILFLYVKTMYQIRPQQRRPITYSYVCPNWMSKLLYSKSCLCFTQFCNFIKMRKINRQTNMRKPPVAGRSPSKTLPQLQLQDACSNSTR